MKNIILITIIGAAATGGYFAFSGKKIENLESSLEATETKEENKEEKITSKDSGNLSINIFLCNQVPNGNYFCPAEALSDFARTVKGIDGKTCSVSYDSKNGFTFSGPTKNANLEAGEIAVGIHSNGNLSAVARQTSQNLTLSVSEAGKLNSAMLLDSDYSQDMCLDIEGSTESMETRADKDNKARSARKKEADTKNAQDELNSINP